MFRVIVSYPGFNTELEEELYFATRRRPDQTGQNIVKPPVPAELPEGRIHFPELVDQHHRFLSYTCKAEDEAQALAQRFGVVVAGVGTVQVVDDRPAVSADPLPLEAPAVSSDAQ